MLNPSLPELQSPLSESSPFRPCIQLNDQWRVVACRDGIQWILQFRNSAITAAGDWRGRSYCRTREALLRCCVHHCGPIGPIARAALEALPARFGQTVSESRLEVPPRVPCAPEILARSETVSAETNAEKFNELGGQIRRGRSSFPLDLIGGGSCRFPRARTAERSHQTKAVIDAEIGTGDLVMSRDGVPPFESRRRCADVDDRARYRRPKVWPSHHRLSRHQTTASDFMSLRLQAPGSCRGRGSG